MQTVFLVLFGNSERIKVHQRNGFEDLFIGSSLFGPHIFDFLIELANFARLLLKLSGLKFYEHFLANFLQIVEL